MSKARDIADLDFNSPDIDGGNIDGATIGGTTPAAGSFSQVNVDNITIDGNEIDVGSGDLTLDVAGDIILDADGGDVNFKDGGTTFGSFNHQSPNFNIRSMVQDGDLKLQGFDGSSLITALILDMSAAGAATFNSSITIPDWVYHSGDSNTYFGFPSDDEFKIVTGNTGRLHIKGSESVWNEGGEDKDFRVESDGNANMLFVDGGNNRVGVGTGSPQAITEIVGTNSGGALDVLNLRNSGGDGSEVTINMISSTDQTNTAARSFIKSIRSGSNPHLTFGTANTERFRIASDGSCRWTPDGTNHDMTLTADGNLLVGGTNSRPAEFNHPKGISFRGDIGQIQASTDGNIPLLLNMDTSDGTILDLRKDGTTVGSIGITSSGFFIDGEADHTGLRFFGGAIGARKNTVDVDATVDLGWSGGRFKDLYLSGGVNNSTGLVSIGNTQSNGIEVLTSTASGQPRLRPSGDNTTDVGESAKRWKDLYLSGRAYINNGIKIDSGDGIYFGQDGTAANKLDDYEEGDFTLVISGTTTAGTNSGGSIGGRYTKIGRQVTCQIMIANTTVSGASGNLKLSGLPFTPSGYANRGFKGTVATYKQNLQDHANNYFGPVLDVGHGTTDIYLLQTRDDANWAYTQVENQSGLYIEGTITYFTT